MSAVPESVIARVISIHFIVISAGDLQTVPNSGASTRRELTVLHSGALEILIHSL